MSDRVRYLLLQVRNSDDPMLGQEQRSFARALRCRTEQLSIFSLLSGPLSLGRLKDYDMVLVGGSGHYSATDTGPWLEVALDSLRVVFESGTPLFASCWGFQALARALGGEVCKDLQRAEVGTHRLQLTADGAGDPIFGPLGGEFHGQMGHEDIVVQLPEGAVLLASSNSVQNQAYCFRDRPVYCTQFHPELNRAELLQRVQAYPEYVERIARMTLGEFCETVRETPETEALLRRFVRMVFD